MGKIENNIRTNYQVIPNELIWDNELSIMARFVFVYMASKPDNWEFYQEPLARELHISADTLRKYLRELTDAGWVIKGEQACNGKGQFGAVSYTLLTEKTRDGKKATPKNTVTEKTRDGKNNPLNNKDNINNIDNIKQEKEKTISKDISKKFDVMRYMTDRNVPESVATDFIALRKVKRAPLTETALKGIEREAAKARISLGTAIEVCCANGWQGFRAEWYNRDKGKTPEIYVDPHTNYDDWTDPSLRL